MKTAATADGLRARLLTALAVSRTAPLNFPGMFMRLAGERDGEHGLRFTYDDRAWARNGAGGARVLETTTRHLLVAD